MKVVIEAGMEITLKGAGGFVKIDPTGVTIQGTLVRINSGGAPGSGSPGTPKPLGKLVGVDPPPVGSPAFNIFAPTNVGEPSDATGSTPVEASEEEG